MSREKISRALLRRPDPQDFRQYLFWLVDVIYACKASKEPALMQQARLLEDALGYLGSFLETGEQSKLTQLHTNLEQFARFVQQPAQAS